MTKSKALKIIDDLIKDEIEAIEGYNKALLDFKDSPRIVSLLGEIYREETAHIERLQTLKKDIEEYNPEKRKMAEIYGLDRGGLCCDYCGFDFEDESDGDK